MNPAKITNPKAPKKKSLVLEGSIRDNKKRILEMNRRLTVQRIKKMPIKNLTAKTKGVASLRKMLEDVVDPVVDRRPHDVAGLVAADSQD